MKRWIIAALFLFSTVTVFTVRADDATQQQLQSAKAQLQTLEDKILRNRTLGGPGMQERQAAYAQQETELKAQIAKLESQAQNGQ